MRKLEAKSVVFREDLVRAQFLTQIIEEHFRPQVDAKVAELRATLDAQNEAALVRLQAAAKLAHLAHVQQARENAREALAKAERAEADAVALADAAEVQS